MEPAFRRPDAYFAVPSDDRAKRVKESDDLVSIDDAAFFLRGVAPIGIVGQDEVYAWGFWVKVSQADFAEYLRFFDVDPPVDHPGFTATIANQTRWLPPTLGLRVHAHLQRERQRPRFMLLDDAHPLTAQQAKGVSASQVHEWSEAVSRQGEEILKEPPRARFTPALEKEGWLVATPEQVGREGVRHDGPVAAGDLVKAPFVFRAADERGNVSDRVELMWVEVDATAEDGWWSGTLSNHPFVPGPLDAGTRVWLRGEHLLAFKKGEAVRPAPAPVLERAPLPWWKRLFGSDG